MKILEKVDGILSGIPMTAVGGIALLLSLVLPTLGYGWGSHLAWVCVVICGLPIVISAAVKLFCNKGISRISSALLISIAMGAALYIGDLFAAGEVVFIMAIGEILENMTVERARKGVRKLASLVPDICRRIIDGKEEEVDVDDIRIGEVVRILPGEIVPVDGTVLSGETTVDQSNMTGESLPVEKGVGDPVYSGTVNCHGSVDIEVTKESEDSSIQRLVRMVEEADSKQANVQRTADKWASWLVPVAAAIAVITFFATDEIVRAVTVLVVFCPCALVLATPTAIVAAIGQAAKHGVIVKSAIALETMGSVTTIAFDKTGTLTNGELSVCDIVPLGGTDGRDLLSIAASVEMRSEHPIARAIIRKADEIGLAPSEADGFRMSAGRGAEATVDGKRYRLGNADFIGGGLTDEVSSILSGMSSEGKASVLVSADDRVIGIISLSDTVRPETAGVIAELNDAGIRTVMLTGDNESAASFFASRTGISETYAGLLPEDKVDRVSALKKDTRVCMVGDGVNDAPALKTADVGVSMGAMGSDIATDAADIALMTDGISKVPYLKWLSDSTVSTIRLAISLSMTINFFAIAASVMGLLNPTTGALVHNAGSCLVVLLAGLLYDKKYPKDKERKNDRTGA